LLKAAWLDLSCRSLRHSLMCSNAASSCNSSFLMQHLRRTHQTQSVEPCWYIGNNAVDTHHCRNTAHCRRSVVQQTNVLHLSGGSRTHRDATDKMFESVFFCFNNNCYNIGKMRQTIQIYRYCVRLCPTITNDCVYWVCPGCSDWKNEKVTKLCMCVSITITRTRTHELTVNCDTHKSHAYNSHGTTIEREVYLPCQNTTSTYTS